MKNTFFLLKIGAFTALFSACKKETFPVQWTQNVVKSDCNWRAVQFFDAQNGVVVGGKTWAGGFALRTKDGGKTWQTDSVEQWSLYALGIDSKAQNTEGSSFFTTGIGGRVFEQKKKDTTFSLSAHPHWLWARDMAVRRGQAVVVGGQGWQNGTLVAFKLGNSARHIDTFPQEFESVAFADDSTVVAVGYGLIVRSTNAGMSWTPLKKWDNDFYQSISFPSEKIGYIVGYSGSILKTTDGGASWSALESAKQFKTKNFRSVFFTDILRGVICGDDGLLWRTLDGGASWQVADGLPKVNFYDVFATKSLQNESVTEGWLVGSGGTIVKFNF
jgi:photosystem II stability/assembly factor-like uncharacterized protein